MKINHKTARDIQEEIARAEKSNYERNRNLPDAHSGAWVGIITIVVILGCIVALTVAIRNLFGLYALCQ